jgi:hypothetical protein
MKKNCRSKKLCLLIPFAVAGFLALFTYAVYALWNGVVTDVFAVKAITYWQALGLLVLCKILFGGFPHRGRCGHSWRDRAMARRWESASPEEREKMRDEMRRRFGDWPRPDCCCSDDEHPETDSKKENPKT